jgi:hypothetical protein
MRPPVPETLKQNGTEQGGFTMNINIKTELTSHPPRLLTIRHVLNPIRRQSNNSTARDLSQARLAPAFWRGGSGRLAGFPLPVVRNCGFR